MDDTVERTAAASGRRGGRREQIKQEKLGRIVRAAAALFAERGFEATTTQAIAEEAGIGAGTLFLYVRSKHDLLVRVVVPQLDAQLSAAASVTPVDAPLDDQVLALFERISAHLERDAALTSAFVKEVLFASEAERPAVQALIERFVDVLSRLVADAQRHGEQAPGLAAGAVADNLFALWFHHLQLRCGGHLAPSEWLPRLRGAVALQLRGCQPGTRPTK